MILPQLLLLFSCGHAPRAVDRSACRAFWSWFVANDDRFSSALAAWDPIGGPPGVPASVSRAVTDVNGRLGQLHPDLAINFGPPVGDGRRELVVTVEGHREAMPYADALVDTAPQLDRWKLVQYKPAIGGADLVVDYEGAELAAKDVEASADLDRQQLVVVLYVRGLSAVRPSASLQGAAVVLLDGMVGERRSLTIDALSAVPFEQAAPPGISRFPITELPARLDALRPVPP